VCGVVCGGRSFCQGIGEFVASNACMGAHFGQAHNALVRGHCLYYFKQEVNVRVAAHCVRHVYGSMDQVQADK
jgi:hypothetical protein